MTKFDLDKDGVVTEEEIMTKERLIEIENRDKKEDQQRRMAWVAMLSMLIFTIVLFTPIISEDRLMALADLFGLFYIAQAGVVAAFFGSSAYMNVTRG